MPQQLGAVDDVEGGVGVGEGEDGAGFEGDVRDGLGGGEGLRAGEDRGGEVRCGDVPLRKVAGEREGYGADAGADVEKVEVGFLWSRA